MTQTINFDIVGSYNNQRISSIDAERSVNMFEYIDQLGKKPKSLINTSGLINTNSAFGTEQGGFRAQFTFKGSEYCVVGRSVFLIDNAGAIAVLGTLNTNSGYVAVDANTFQIIFVDGTDGYIWDTTTSVFATITDPSFPNNPIDACFLDGFFIVASGGTNNFNLSMFNQGLVWGPDNTGVQNTFTLAAGSADITLSAGINVYYQIGTPVVFSGGSLPAELVAGTTYYVVAISGTNIINVSATKGGTAITSVAGGSGSITNNGQLQQGEITTHPGNIVGCRTLHRRLFLFSDFFTEVWENAGIGTNLPFRRNNSLLMEYGTPARGSISVGFDMMAFVSQTRDGLGSVMMVSGTESLAISNRALDYQLAQYAQLNQISDCRGFLIKENGLIFYRMNFTSANHTYVYNVTLSSPSSEETKYWHEEEVLNGDRHPAQTHAYFNGKNYVGHYALPILYELSSTTYTNAGEVIRRMRITKAFVPPGYQRIRIDRLQVDLLQGNISQLQPTSIPFTLTTELGFDLMTEDGNEILLDQGLVVHNPQDLYVFLSISKDGGQSYGYRESVPMGAIGQRTFRTLWRKKGTIPRGQAFVAKFEFFDAVPFIILGASWAIEVLPE